VASKPLKFILAAMLLAAPATTIAAPTASQIAVNTLKQEVEAAAILEELRATAPRGGLAITNVRLVNSADASITPGQTVYVRGSRITWVGPTAEAPDLAARTVIDGKGRFLSPGLTDMHVHSLSAGGWLLNLANGVTTVRDMGGFPWLLRARDNINAGRMLGPTNYVAGTIINGLPFEGYAVVPANPLDARRLVRQQAACGYDFIKVHNRVPQPTFDAVADQALTLGMDLVGHVPHDISIEHALQSGKMRTAEHLKGFLIDQALLPSDEDYAKALSGAEIWITPTLYTRLGYDRGNWARSILAGPSARYVPLRVREQWRKTIATPDADNLKLGARFRNTQDVVMRRLLPLRPHWLAGTDAAGYAFNIMGFALLEELRLMQEHGLTPSEALRAATTEPAAAMRQPTEFGRIAPGMRADLVLLDANPLRDTAAYRVNHGVMAHGVWLDRGRLDSALDRLARSYALADGDTDISLAAVGRLKANLIELQGKGFVFDPEFMKGAAAALKAEGRTTEGKVLEALAETGVDGPCAQHTPMD
jgi:hypothetical protein